MKSIGLRALLISACLSVMLAQFAIAQSWTSDGPVPRWFHSAVLNPTTNRMVIFGGLPSADTTASLQNLSDVWRFNVVGSAWTHVKPTGGGPGPRRGATADPSTARGREA